MICLGRNFKVGSKVKCMTLDIVLFIFLVVNIDA